MLASVSETFEAPLEAPKLVETVYHANGLLELRLNRPSKFNSLDREMLEAIGAALRGPRPAGILLSAVPGKAFCAGGDIKYASELPTALEKVDFLHLEYSVHQALFEAWAVHTLPVVAVADGIVMGAGAGLFMAANTRIATERTVFAMPEAAIGLCPDAGALHFLRKDCPPTVGLYLALTGAHVGPADLGASGLATHALGAEQAAELIAALAMAPAAAFPGLLAALPRPDVAGGKLAAVRGTVDAIFALDGPHAKNSMDEVGTPGLPRMQL
jgi:enoyl-CoA hydratase